jgi:Ca2+-binding RTX toxin-like protein
MPYWRCRHDKLEGGDGTDTLNGGDGNDNLRGGAGDDVLAGDAGHYEIFGDAGLDWLDGGDGNDNLRGGDGDDSLKGGAGNDRLDGNTGNNLLDGDAGTNTLKNGTEIDFDAPPPPADFEPLLAALTQAMNEGSQHLGQAIWERESSDAGLETFLHIIVQGGPANTSQDVFVNGANIGTIQFDGDGYGELRFGTFPDQPGELPLPFESLDDGATIGIARKSPACSAWCRPRETLHMPA